MAQAGSGKWERLGQALMACCGPNLERLQNGIKIGMTVENARSGTTAVAAAKKRPGRKKSIATAAI
ncbi:MAG: hypothetical protein ACLQUY_20085 [Ktedonobacterales bacterium]